MSKFNVEFDNNFQTKDYVEGKDYVSPIFPKLFIPRPNSTPSSPKKRLKVKHVVSMSPFRLETTVNNTCRDPIINLFGPTSTLTTKTSLSKPCPLLKRFKLPRPLPPSKEIHFFQEKTNEDKVFPLYDDGDFFHEARFQLLKSEELDDGSCSDDEKIGKAQKFLEEEVRAAVELMKEIEGRAMEEVDGSVRDRKEGRNDGDDMGIKVDQGCLGVIGDEGCGCSYMDDCVKTAHGIFENNKINSNNNNCILSKGIRKDNININSFNDKFILSKYDVNYNINDSDDNINNNIKKEKEIEYWRRFDELTKPILSKKFLGRRKIGFGS